MALMLWILPSTLLVCVHVTNAVFSLKSGRRVSGVSKRESFGGVHHLMVWLPRAASRTHGEVLASWSIEESMSSDEGGRFRMRERLENSWVVEGPITAGLSVIRLALVIGGRDAHRSRRRWH